MNNDLLKTNLITALGINNLSEEKQEEIIIQAGNVIFQGVLNKVIPLLTDSEKTEFEKILDNSNGDTIGMLNFLQAKVPNLERIIQGEVADFKQESLNVMSGIGK